MFVNFIWKKSWKKCLFSKILSFNIFLLQKKLFVHLKLTFSSLFCSDSHVSSIINLILYFSYVFRLIFCCSYLNLFWVFQFLFQCYYCLASPSFYYFFSPKLFWNYLILRLSTDHGEIKISKKTKFQWVLNKSITFICIEKQFQLITLNPSLWLYFHSLSWHLSNTFRCKIQGGSLEIFLCFIFPSIPSRLVWAPNITTSPLFTSMNINERK